MPNATNYPRTWNFAQDGELYGGYVETRQVTLKDGHVSPVIEFKLADTNEPVSMWLSGHVLRRKFTDELRRRVKQGKDDFEPGERIRIIRGAEKKPSAQGNGYWPYEVEFEFAVKETAASILLSDEPDPDEPAAADDDIPF